MPNPRPDTGSTIPAPGSSPVRRGERVYASFVIRLWHEAGSRRLLRVEIEHTQSGGLAHARGVSLAWIGRAIGALLGDPSAPNCPAHSQDPRPE